MAAKTSKETSGEYWTLVDHTGPSRTYERRLPNGMLIRVRTGIETVGGADHFAESVVFVPAEAFQERT